MRTTTLIISLISFSLSLRAGHPNEESKNTDLKRWKSGFIVTLQGDTVKGSIKVNDFLDTYYDFQHMLSFRDSRGTTQYSPNDLASYSYHDQNNTVTMQSVSSPEGDGRVFLRLYYSGGCKVYGYVVTEMKGANGDISGSGMLRSSLIPNEKKYLQVGGSQFYQLKRIGFKKSMEDAFASCPRILSGLAARTYTYDNLQALVQDYNGLK